MDVNAVLTNTLSPDASLRTQAEQQLSQAAEADFPGYLTTLSSELANEQAQSQVRIAAGLALKNSFSARDYTRLREVQNRWLSQIDPSIKTQVKNSALQTLSSSDSRAGQSAAQFISSIAAIELPREQWPELMPTLVENVGSGSDQKKQSSLTAIGFICETEDQDLRDSLAQHSNAILTAVVQGARKEEQNNDIRNAAITALGDSLEFVRTNFENEGERNYIMQVICEATQADDMRIQQGAYGCLNRIMGLYYEKMRFYMEKALFGLTIQGMKNDEEDVAKLAVEFWCTVCEEEISIEDDNAQAESQDAMREYFNFARVATQEVVPVLLELLAKQDEDATDDEYNISRAAYQCVQLWAQAVGSQVVPPVLTFVEANLRNEDWHYRDAAVSAFGAIMEGPDEKVLDPLVKQALPVLIGMMNDQSVQVKDSAAYALGRICEAASDSIDPNEHLQSLITALFQGLASHPKMASSCCWALMNLADRFAGEPGCQTNALSQHFQASVQHLLQVTEVTQDNQLRTAAYEVLNAFVTNAANDSVQMVASLSEVVIDRLEKTIPMQSQVVSVEDRLTLEEIQTSLTSVIIAIIQRLEKEIVPQADRIMQLLLQLLSSLGGKSSVPDTIFAAIGALANALETDFEKYMAPFAPYLLNALNNQEEPQLCAMAIGLVSDITRALENKVQPFCDQFMNSLLNNLRSTTLGNQFKPAILQCFGDIAQAIGGDFETYLSVVAQVLQQAAGISAQENSANFEMLDYIVSLREGIMDAWGGIIMAVRSGQKGNLLQPYIDSIFLLLQTVYQDPNRTEALLRSSMGVVGDISEAFPNGEYSHYFRADWLTAMARDTRANKDFSPRTQETARWAREQIKRQSAAAGNVQMS